MIRNHGDFGSDLLKRAIKTHIFRVDSPNRLTNGTIQSHVQHIQVFLLFGIPDCWHHIIFFLNHYIRSSIPQYLLIISLSKNPWFRVKFHRIVADFLGLSILAEHLKVGALLGGAVASF